MAPAALQGSLTVSNLLHNISLRLEEIQAPLPDLADGWKQGKTHQKHWLFALMPIPHTDKACAAPDQKSELPSAENMDLRAHLNARQWKPPTSSIHTPSADFSSRTWIIVIFFLPVEKDSVSAMLITPWIHKTTLTCHMSASCHECHDTVPTYVLLD